MYEFVFVCQFMYKRFFTCTCSYTHVDNSNNCQWPCLGNLQYIRNKSLPTANGDDTRRTLGTAHAQ